MTKFLKSISAFAVVLISIFMLSACEYDFYNDWSNAGAVIEKDNVFEVVSVDTAKSMIDDDRSFALVLATSEADLAPTTMSILQEDADALSFDGKLQFIDCTLYVNKPADRRMLKETFGVNDPSKISSNLVVLLYNKGELLVDTTCDALEDDTLKYFNNGSGVNYSALATYIYSDFIFE